VQKPRPPPERNHKIKIVSRFFQVIHAALFCAALPRGIKTHLQSRDKKARPRLCVKSIAKGKHGTNPQGITPNPARRPAGQGQERRANPHALLSRIFLQATVTAAYRRPCFQHFLQTVTPVFLAPQSSAHKSPVVKRRKKPRHPAPGIP
jgi:hypothetical protein